MYRSITTLSYGWRPTNVKKKKMLTFDRLQFLTMLFWTHLNCTIDFVLPLRLKQGIVQTQGMKQHYPCCATFFPFFHYLGIRIKI